MPFIQISRFHKVRVTQRTLFNACLFFSINSDKASGHGILEFSTDKAGQDVTPLNLEFDEPKQRSSTLNSITGENSPIQNDFLYSSFFSSDFGVMPYLLPKFSLLFASTFCLRNVVLCTTHRNTPDIR